MNKLENNSMTRLIITKYKDMLLTALVSGQQVLELSLEDASTVFGNIYVGKVKNIVRSLNSAFVDYEQGRTGYYSLTDNPHTIYAGGSSPGKLKIGDEIVVQVAKDAMKTKEPVLTSNLNFTGKYAVLTAANHIIGFSAKITDREWKERLRPQLEQLVVCGAGIIVRTNAYGHEEALYQEIRYLARQYDHVMETAPYRACYSLLYKAEPGYIRSLKSRPSGSLKEIVTDETEVYENIRQFLVAYQPGDVGLLRFYDDKMVSLDKVYSLETAFRQACQKKVWLKSGGYLVIEPTEAMVVIDVNTGKYSGKKDLEETIRKINLEAAQEVCRQLRLRNLSGIIIVDFIDMKEENDRQMLLEELRKYVLNDSVKTTVVDMTSLGLVEMTRKKERRPLYEQQDYFK